MSKLLLFERLDGLVREAVEALERLPWEVKEVYGQWLAQTYYYTCHTTRLLALAGAKMPLDESALHNRFLKHAAEEKGHEKLTLLDLKNMNRSIAEFPEHPVTRSFYQIQYHWIENSHPLAFFGFILYLESIAAKAGTKLGQKVENVYGPQCSHFLRVHGEEDIDHVKEALSYVGSMPPEIQQEILLNLEQSADLYQGMLHACSESKNFRSRAA